jgi:septal ring factor EnvC (AmiA/AmiB activator)
VRVRRVREVQKARSHAELSSGKEGGSEVNPAILQQPIFQVTLPIVLAMGGTVWALISTNNRRLDDIRADLKDLRGDLKDVNRRLDKIDETLKTYGQKIAVLEDRSSPLGRR